MPQLITDLQQNGKIGLLTPTGHYNVKRYPWAHDAFVSQHQNHWTPWEIPLGDDRKDWDQLNEVERNLLTQIFRFFTQSDIEVSDNYMKRFIPIFRPLEIELMMGAFTAMEGIHIKSYAMLLDTLDMPETEFQAFHQYSQMQEKHDYMQKFGVETDVDVARTLAMFGAFTEGMSLFASFVMLLNFPRHNKMNNMGQVVTYSIRDENLHCNAMIQLFHEWCKETGCLTREVVEDIREVAAHTVTLEDNFIDLAFEMGPVEGLSAEEVKQYIRFICDQRLMQLHMKPLFNTTKHPLPWLNNMLNSYEKANFFEQRATEYSKGATSGDWASTWDRFDDRKANSQLQQPL